ncbi:DEAD/DEAH box helicase family protein [Xenorhabdus bovienii]|uniref:DEAD/DEAH box helicase family protein n=1 Tax=Xenorhabdus bovienii TaxID=40576 RepID=UPI0023B2916D|nr:DEAD/DEAH box helicase family protein [Xenorhabdus bovienii]MDE9475339.1 DEAD/DEAH box helicase family protein [Xenorhabdus bovienii]
MIDFKNKLKKKELQKRINPIEIYESLDRRSEAGPLRPSQKRILEEWFNNRRNDKDNIIKLHTGEGKTLIGLLILQSKINETNSPCLYVCPNIYLAKQAVKDAEKFGIPYCIIDHSKVIPDDFHAGRKILITHVQKLFNGKTVFGLGSKSIQVNSIILDDSQACIDSIKNSFTIKVDKYSKLYTSILNIFSDELREQGEGSYLEMENGIGSNTLLPIPYWSWIDKKELVAQELLKNIEDNRVSFIWPLIKNEIHNCQAFISGETLEISPIFSLIDSFGSFSKAAHRFLMSATTQDDSFFIKGLGFDVEAVKKPLVNQDLIWSGEKMILIPSLIDENLDREKIINWILKPNDKQTFGTVCLAPSFSNTKQFQRIGATVATTETIYDCIDQLKRGIYSNAIVFANRYDGIDLPDNSCRILVLDSKPYSETLSDRYEEECRPSSDIINVKTAQRVEQGLGRSVRGEKDYSVIIITGGDLVQFLKSPLTTKYFSPQTRMQIEIGSQIVGFAKDEIEEGADIGKLFIELINKSSLRDEGWKEYYVERMNEINIREGRDNLYDLITLEYKAENLFIKDEIDKACMVLQNICDKHVEDEMEKGWYLQLQARYKYNMSKVESNKIQKSAFQRNSNLLKPKDGIIYKKIDNINSTRANRIIKWVSAHDDYQSLMIAVHSILQNISFGVQSDKFEDAIHNLGLSIGFVCQRPDKEIKKGPDNLWGDVDGHYFLFECKNEVDESRSEINKTEAGQMNNHCGWFAEEYGDVTCKKIIIINTRVLSYQSNFNEEIFVMRKSKLKLLKSNLLSFFKEFKDYDLHSLDEATIHKFIGPNKIDIESLMSIYTESITKASR